MLSEYRRAMDDRLAEFRGVQSQIKSEISTVMQAEEDLDDAVDAQKILQSVAQIIQQEAHNRIASVVSRCLESVFDEPYEFRIVFEKKRGSTEARLCFVRDGMDVDPLTASGGGVVDVASFALRLSCMVLSRPATRRLLVLDEPFRFVSREYRSRIRMLLETLAEEMHVQFLMVTHIDELRCGKVIEL